MFYCDDRFIQLVAKHVQLQMPLVRRLVIHWKYGIDDELTL